MELSILEYYLIGINALGLVLYGIRARLYPGMKAGWGNAILTAVVLAGGSLGVLLAILVFDGKAEKRNMMTLVLAVCALVVQIVALLFCGGVHQQQITFDFGGFFAENRWLALYLLAMNAAACIAFAVDKYRAVRRHSRIRIVTLLLLAFLGGSVGALLAMAVFRHKTRKDYFSIGVPMMLVTHIILLFYIMNV